MTRKAHYSRPEDVDLTDAVFPLYSLEMYPLGKGAGSGNRSAATARLVFLGYQSRSTLDGELMPLKGDCHSLELTVANLKAIHTRLKAAGLVGGLLDVIAEFEAEAAAVEVKPDGDYNPLYSSIEDGIDIELS